MSGSTDLGLILSLMSLAVGLAPPLHAVQGRRLNGPLPANGDVARYSISADGKHALYVADESPLDETYELYSARLDARTPAVRLNPPLAAFGQVRFELSTQDRVVYGANWDGAVQLFSVPIDGGTSIILNPPLVAGGNVRGMSYSTSPTSPVAAAALTSDGTRVVYVADQEVLNRQELYVVPIDASGPAVKVSHVLPAGWAVRDFVLDPEGTQVLYTTKTGSGSTSRVRVHIAPLDGSAGSLQLAETPPAELVGSLRFSPDRQWITYQRFPDPSVFLWGPELCIVPVDGSRPALELSDNTNSGSTYACTFTSGGDRAVFLESFLYNGFLLQYSNLCSSTLDGVGTRIDGGMGICGCPGITAFQLGPDGSTVFYSSTTGIFRVPADGSTAPLNLAAAGTATGDILLTADGSRLVYTTFVTISASKVRVGLHCLTLSNGTVTDLCFPLDVPSFKPFAAVKISSDSRYVLYLLAKTTNSDYELYSVPIDGSSAPRRLNGALPAGGGATSFQAVGGDVVYRADAETNEVFELFSVRLDPLARTSKPVAPHLQGTGG